MFIFLALEERRGGKHLWRLVGQGTAEDVEYWHSRYNADRGYIAVKVIDGSFPAEELQK